VEKGYSVLFASTDNDFEREKHCIKTLLDQKVDGLLVNTADYEGAYLNDLATKQFPIVLLERCLKDNYILDSVISESRNSTYDCMRYLYQQGFRYVGFFGNEFHRASSRIMRRESYLRATQEIFNYNGMNDFYIVTEDLKQSEAAVEKFISYPTQAPKVIFCVNGVAMLHTLRAIFSLGIAITPQFGICGFDDWGWASLIGPGITTITQNSYEVGTSAAQLLIDRIEGKIDAEPVHLEILGQLIKRGSTEGITV
jgi:LacI family kdg operon repressor